jgi:hypothetical protein
MGLDARIVAWVQAQADARQLGARRTGLNAPKIKEPHKEEAKARHGLQRRWKKKKKKKV